MTIVCAAYRRSILADPRDADLKLRAHRDSCAECAEFSQRVARFESRLARALAIDLDAAAGAARPFRARRAGSGYRGAGVGRRGWMALAASLTMAIGVAAGLWLAAPRASLAADVVTHMAEEPQAWRSTDVPVSSAALGAVLHDAHMRLTAKAGLVSYANSCLFRGHQVPHLVVQSDGGPVTVMVLVHESVPAEVQFADSGYRGVILPVPGHGSIAVLTRGAADRATVERIAARVLGAIVWTA
jgi:hypothetical protein